jgi:hypothetical protein
MSRSSLTHVVWGMLVVRPIRRGIEEPGLDEAVGRERVPLNVTVEVEEVREVRPLIREEVAEVEHLGHVVVVHLPRQSGVLQVLVDGPYAWVAPGQLFPAWAVDVAHGRARMDEVPIRPRRTGDRSKPPIADNERRGQRP